MDIGVNSPTVGTLVDLGSAGAGVDQLAASAAEDTREGTSKQVEEEEERKGEMEDVDPNVTIPLDSPMPVASGAGAGTSTGSTHHRLGSAQLASGRSEVSFPRTVPSSLRNKVLSSYSALDEKLLWCGQPQVSIRTQGEYQLLLLTYTMLLFFAVYAFTKAHWAVGVTYLTIFQTVSLLVFRHVFVSTRKLYCITTHQILIATPRLSSAFVSTSNAEYRVKRIPLPAVIVSGFFGVDRHPDGTGDLIFYTDRTTRDDAHYDLGGADKSAVLARLAHPAYAEKVLVDILRGTARRHHFQIATHGNLINVDASVHRVPRGQVYARGHRSRRRGGGGEYDIDSSLEGADSDDSNSETRDTEMGVFDSNQDGSGEGVQVGVSRRRRCHKLAMLLLGMKRLSPLLLPLIWLPAITTFIVGTHTVLGAVMLAESALAMMWCYVLYQSVRAERHCARHGYDVLTAPPPSSVDTDLGVGAAVDGSVASAGVQADDPPRVRLIGVRLGVVAEGDGIIGTNDDDDDAGESLVLLDD